MMKLGCAAWNLTPTYDSPFEGVIETIAQLGFQGFELIAAGRQIMDEYYTTTRCDQLARQAAAHKLQISQFVIYAHAIEGLASLNADERERSLIDFEHGVRIAKALGAPIVNTVSHWLPGLEAATPYPPALIYITIPGLQRFDPKLTFTYPDFDWDQVWDNYVESMRICAGIAADHGLQFALEGHPHVIVSHTDSFLRLFDRVPHPALGMNYDTGMQSDQREYIPFSIKKLKHRIFHTHIRDSDSLLTHQLPCGQGVLNWPEILRTLQSVGYDGFLSLEFSGYKEPEKYLLQSRLYLEQILADIAR